MYVAKSYQNLEMVGEPYEENGRMYVAVKLKSGNIKAVRAYTEKEYNKMYGNGSAAKSVSSVEVKAIQKTAVNRKYGGQKAALGFQKGYITIFKGEQYPHLDYFRLSNARYCNLWGWYVVSEEKVPEDLPYGIEPVRLDWELVGADEYNLKSDQEVIKAVEPLIYNEGKSKFQGEIGSRLEVTVSIDRAILLEGNYGLSHMYVMSDDDENIYIWTTSAKNWEEGEVHTIRGTVKEHKIYRGNRQTVLTRCVER